MRRASVFLLAALFLLLGGFTFLSFTTLQPERQEVRIILPDSSFPR